ncbi:MAG: hypothetical protein HXY52_04010 [Nitrospirae bacterium]|jgi:putative membrane protein|nr:hypothetical protein [Nitrospirota bacterium]
MIAEKFFSEYEKNRISDAIKSVEKKTIGEVAVMVVDSSDKYPEAEVLGGITLGSFLSFVITFYFFHSSLWWYIPLSFTIYFPARLLFHKIPELKKAFISKNRQEKAVLQRAVRAFYEKGLYKTRQNTGVLFFISLFEHKVWVLADKGIYEKIQQGKLDNFAQKVTKGIKEKRACDALCEAIFEAGELLALYFPIKPDDINELTDKVIIEQ